MVLGASDTADRLGAVAGDVDVVLDYLWGAPTAEAMATVVTARRDRSAPLTWVQIGAVTGATAAIPSAALRASRLQVVGSGQGSVPTQDIVAELPDLTATISAGTFTIDAEAVALSSIEEAWSRPGTGRVVLVP